MDRSVSTPQLGPCVFEEQLIELLSAEPAGEKKANVTLTCRLPAMVRTCGKYLKAYVVAVDTAVLRANSVGDGIDPYKAARKKLLAQECLCAPKHRLIEECSTFTLEISPSPILGGKAQVLLQVVVEAPVDPNFWTPVGKSVMATAVAPALELIMMQDYVDQNPAVKWRDTRDSGCQTNAATYACELIRHLNRRKIIETPTSEECSDDELLTGLKMFREFLKNRCLLDEIEEDNKRKSEEIESLEKRMAEEIAILEKRKAEEIQHLMKLSDKGSFIEQELRRDLQREVQARKQAEDLLAHSGKQLQNEISHREQVEQERANLEAALDSVKKSLEQEVQTRQRVETAHAKETVGWNACLENTKSNLMDVEQVLKEQRQARSLAEQTKRKLEEDMHQKELEHEELEEAKQQLQKELKVARASMMMTSGEAQLQLAELQKQQSTLTSELSAERSERSKAAAANSDLEKKLSRMQTQFLSESKADRSASEASEAQLKQENDVLIEQHKKELELHKKDLEEHKKRLAAEIARSASVEAAKTATEAKLFEVTNELSEVQSEREEIRQTVRRASIQRRNSTLATVALKERLAEIEEVETVQERLAEIEAELAVEQEQTRQHASEAASASSTSNALLAEVEKTLAESRSLQDECKDQEIALRSKELELKALRTEHNQLRGSRMSMKEHEDMSQEMRKVLNEEHHQERQRMQHQFTLEKEDLSSSNKKLQADKASLTHNLDATTAELESIRKQIEAYKKKKGCVMM